MCGSDIDDRRALLDPWRVPHRMSYEDMLRVFGPGHVPEKASVETVTSLPVTLMTDAELERLQRPDVQEGRDCLVCMVRGWWCWRVKSMRLGVMSGGA